jgi:hypothetical protein
VLAVAMGVLALLGPAAVAAPSPRAVGFDEPGVTFGLQPTQTVGKPFRPNFVLDLPPGGEAHDTFRVRNDGSATQTFTLFAGDAFNAATGAIDLKATGKPSRDIGTWITLEKNSIELAGGQFADVGFTLKVPASATPGDHTAGIVASLGTSPGAAGPSVSVDRRIGTRVLLRVAGDLKPSLKLSDLKTSFNGPISPVGRGTMNVTYRVSNVGNVAMGVDQKIKVNSPFGFPAKTVTPAQIADLLPGNSITVTEKVSGVWPTLRSMTKVSLSPVSINPGDSFPPTVATRASSGTWTLPWAFLVLVILILAGFLAWQRRQQQAHNRRASELEALVDARMGAGAGTGDASYGGPSNTGSSL